MRNLFIASFFLFGLISCENANNTTEEKTQDQQETTVTSDTSGSNADNATGQVYTCPMHPEVTSDKPGKCPKCKMDLVLKESLEENNE